ncbi:MAG: hypothetical protein H8E57_04765, partial [Candidatus Cloacimonetes bacterium]|nr:hypothetical protein [Candidatus Cloacimonadota bacterium]
DIIGRYIPKPDDLFPYIIDENITEVEFHFVPDKLDLKSIQTIDFKENQLHIIGAFPFTSEKFIFPYTSHA